MQLLKGPNPETPQDLGLSGQYYRAVSVLPKAVRILGVSGPLRSRVTPPSTDSSVEQEIFPVACTVAGTLGVDMLIKGTWQLHLVGISNVHSILGTSPQNIERTY